MSNPTYNPGPGPAPMVPPPPPKKKRTGLIILIVIGVILIALIGSCAAVIGAMGNAANEALKSDPPVVVEEDSSEAPAEKKDSKPAEKESAPAEEKEQEPYTIKATECKRRGGDYSFGMVDIKVKITNHTDKKMTYFFDIAVEDTDGNVVGSGAGSVDNVRAGKSGTASTYVSMDDEDYDGKIKCIIEVTDLNDF